jgi:hypothetical protein
VLGRLKPTGLTGQLVVLGQAVGRLVDTSVVDHHVVEVPGAGRLLYSGDLACYARPGELRFMGKLGDVSDDQFIDNKMIDSQDVESQTILSHDLESREIENRQIDSREIESKEIENKLCSFDGVLNAKLVQSEHEWVVYLQLANQQTFSAEALRNKVQWICSEKNIPLRFVSVDQLPSDAEGDAA